MCIRNNSATNPMRIPVPLANERNRRRRSSGDVGRLGLGRLRPKGTSLRHDLLREVGGAPSFVTGLSRFLARRDFRQLSG
jgi:hypothetical protein